ncbi:hypothetical protein, partial [Actinokineospora diospyrosa]|uniref:hypothetical protein n=1 Tax=Actinokineospora diospyrosa TaxID=103728 RepID=UPI0031D364DC
AGTAVAPGGGGRQLVVSGVARAPPSTATGTGSGRSGGGECLVGNGSGPKVPVVCCGHIDVRRWRR